MNYFHSRRAFLRSIWAVPLLASVPALSHGRDEQATSEKYGHKFKLSLNVYSFNRLLLEGKIDLYDVLDFCAAFNLDAIDPTGYYFPGYPEVPSDKYIHDFKRKAFLLGLDISGTGVRNDFTNPDETYRRKDMMLVKNWIRAAAKLGIPNLRVFAGKHKHTGYTRDQVFDWLAKDLRECCEFGAQHGIIIALQNHNDFLKTSADVHRIFEMVNSEWLGLNLDIGSYRQADPYDEIEQTIQYAVTWQIKENVWIEGRETPTDFVKLFRLIKKAGYRGYLPLETLGEGDPHEKVSLLLEKARQAILEVGD
jgi:sugar phosphate isomerase/epimerase